MHFGEYERTVDQKGRLSVPSHLLGVAEEADWTRVMIVKGDHRCLYLYDAHTWQAVLQQAYRSMDDDEIRLFMHRALADAQLSDVDTMNRITIPVALLSHAGIEKRSVIVGMFNRLELWEPTIWQEYLAGGEDIELPSISDLSRVRIREVS